MGIFDVDMLHHELTYRLPKGEYLQRLPPGSRPLGKDGFLVEWLSEDGVSTSWQYTDLENWRQDIALWLYEVCYQWFPPERALEWDGMGMEVEYLQVGVLRHSTQAMQLFKRMWKHYFPGFSNPIPRLIRANRESFYATPEGERNRKWWNTLNRERSVLTGLKKLIHV
jgi:hypothetical protein